MNMIKDKNFPKSFKCEFKKEKGIFEITNEITFCFKRSFSTKAEFTLLIKDIKEIETSRVGTKIKIITKKSETANTFEFQNIQTRDVCSKILKKLKGIKTPKEVEEKFLILSKNVELKKTFDLLVKTNLLEEKDFWEIHKVFFILLKKIETN
jgi:hypothetical protein